MAVHLFSRVAAQRMFTTERGDQPGVPNVLVIITDGKSNNEEETWRMAMEAREKGITIIAIGVGQSVNLRELQGMASDPTDANVIRVSNFGDLRGIQDRIIRSLCNSKCNIIIAY